MGGLFRVAQDECNTATASAPRCVVAAGDFLDTKLRKPYIEKYKLGARLGAKRHVWAIHSYSAVHRKNRTTYLAPFLKATKGDVWVTEVGSYYSWARPKTVPKVYYPGFEPDVVRQFDRLRWMLDKFVPWRYPGQSSRIKRLYYYQWADNDEAHSSGLVRNVSDNDISPGRPLCLWHHRSATAAARTSACG